MSQIRTLLLVGTSIVSQKNEDLVPNYLELEGQPMTSCRYCKKTSKIWDIKYKDLDFNILIVVYIHLLFDLVKR